MTIGAQRLLIIGGALLLLGSAATAAPHTYTVEIAQLKFVAPPAEVHVGDTIIWVNRDILRHSATAVDHSFDVDLQPGAKGKVVIRKKGSIAFLCRYHPGMKGVLHVQ